MMTNSERKWTLMVPFIAAPNLTLAESHATIFNNFPTELRPGAFAYTNVVIKDLNSEPEARSIFKSLRIGFLAASLNVGWGIRVRGEALTLDDESPIPSEVDIPLIYRDGKDLSRLLLTHGSIEMQVSKVLPTLMASLEFGLRSSSARQALLNERVQLAAELYVDSYFELSDSARFLALVGALEVLKDNRPVSDAARSLVNAWIQEASTLSPEESASIQGSLRYLTRISIARGINSTVSRHLGEGTAREALALYQIRSKLVHDGQRLTDPLVTIRSAQQIVRDLLAHIMMTGTL